MDRTRLWEWKHHEIKQTNKQTIRVCVEKTVTKEIIAIRLGPDAANVLFKTQ